MSQAPISRLNYDAVLGSEDHQTKQVVLETEIVTRFMLGSGFPNQTTQFGIVDGANPANITSSETGRPLFVQVSTQNALAVSVNAGYAISPNGTILNVPTFQQIVSLASSPQSGKIYVVMAVASLNTTDGSTELNDYQVSLSSQQTVFTTVSSIEYVSGWTPDETQVPLAVVKVVDLTGGGQGLVIDLTQNTYAFNRPWYSVVATKHESKLGSGTSTDTNPHATSVNDLTQPGTVGIFQGLTGQGIIVSRDLLRNKMPGALICNDTIDFAHIKTDTTGSATLGSPYSKAGAQYCELTKFPLRLGSVYDVTSPSLAISGEVIPGTNILVFGPNETFTSDQTLGVQYTSAAALRPPTVLTSNFLTFTQPDTGEAIVSGGFIYPSVPDPTMSFEGTGPIARRYQVYLMPSGVLAAFPQIMVPAQSALTSISGTFTPQFPARISVGLTNTTGSSSLNVVATVVGTTLSETDSNPATVTETLTFTPASGFVDQIVPSNSYDLPGQILVTSNRFITVTSISLTVANAGPSPQVQVWAEVEPGLCPDLNDAAAVATIGWNGNAVNQVTDARKVQRIWTPERQHLMAAGEAELDSIRMLNSMKNSVTTLTNSSLKMFTEDFEDLKHFDSLWGFSNPTNGVGVIGLNSSIALQAGDTIQVTNTKTLNAVSGSPVNPGDFSVGTLLSPVAVGTIVTNIITAINDTAFASLVVASQSGSNPLNILVTLQSPLGVAANGVTSATTSNVGAVSVTGFNFAADGYGECYLDRNQIGLSSPVIPADGNLNPYQYNYRKRYRSRAYSLLPSVGAQSKFMVEIHGQDKSFPDSVRIRGSKFINAQVWDAWQVMPVAPVGLKGLYVVTFGSTVHKVQVEYYGKARGLSVYMIRP